MASGLFANASHFALNHSIFIDQPNYFVNSQVNITGNEQLSPIKQIAPCTSQLFTGQEQYLEALNKHFKPEISNNLSRKYFLLYGMGGIGKTQICLKYIDDTEDFYEYTFWIDSSSEDTVVQSLRDIFKTYLASQRLEFSPAVVLNWISIQKCRWLIIFDNADGPPKTVENFLPPRNKGNILITSRNQELKKITTVEHSMEVTEMSEDTSVHLLLNVCGLYQKFDSYKNVAKDIISELYGLPLAIDHAGAYILSGSCDIMEFKSIYKKHRAKLLNNETYCGASKYDKTVYGTWEISFQKIVEISEDVKKHDKACAARYAIIIINICAFLHHENIPQIMFKRAAENYHVTLAQYPDKRMFSLMKNVNEDLFNFDDNGEWNYLIFNEAISMLLSFSLIKKYISTKEHSLHPIVQHWCQDRLSTTEKKSWILNTSMILATSIKEENTIEEYAYNQAIVVHAITILSNEDELYSHQDYILLSKLAIALRKTGMHKIEVSVRDRILKITKQIYTEEHPNTLKSMDSIAVTYAWLGRYKEAEELQVQALEIGTRAVGKEHPDTLKSMANVACTYRNLGKWNEAEELEVPALEIRTRVLGKEHPDTLVSMANLGSTYRFLGKWKEAEELEVKTLEIRTRALGKEHPDTLKSMVNLACTYGNLGKWKEAEELQVLALEIRTRVLGKEHPDTLQSMANLACTYQYLEKWKKAEELEVSSLDIRTRVLGKEHPGTLTSMANLATTYFNIGKLKEAEELSVHALELETRILGTEHPDTLISMTNLACTYGNLGKLKEAEELEVKTLEIRTRVLGKEHPDTIDSMANLAFIYSNLGKWKEAEELQVPVLEISIRVLGKDHPDTLKNMSNLANTYRSLGKLKEVEELEVPTLEIGTRVLGKEHPETLRIMANLALTYGNLGKWKEAKELQVSALEIGTRVLGKEHPETLQCMANLACTYGNLGKWKEAEEIGMPALEIRTRVLGKEHPNTLKSMENLACIYGNLGNLKDAEELELQALEISTTVLGKEHPETLRIMAKQKVK
ncbi:hypothetical protein BDQ17DRAFT_1374523 [Cyathus striatus]|nr:hypothetical protein BDQ17DRAFT_1374523 [Cyathus striatus]